MADGFRESLALPPVARAAAANEHEYVDVLIYDPVLVQVREANEYGYSARKSGDVGVIGMSPTKRFLFVDVAARPFARSVSATPTEGELLTAVSKEQESYAAELSRIIAANIAPERSPNMRRFPAEGRLSFNVMHIDVTAVVGTEKVQRDAASYPIGATFDHARFKSLVASVLESPALKKSVSVEITKIDTKEPAVSMAVTRAFSIVGNDFVLDSDVLLRDMVLFHETALDGSLQAMGFYTDLSFVAHVPVYLFSFAESSRVVHFTDGEHVHAKAVGKEAVIVTENRLRGSVEHSTTDSTGLAVVETMELLCGLDPRVMLLVDLADSFLPPLILDIARRNVIGRQLAWSRKVAVKPAEEALNFDGYDRTVIPHGEHTPLGQSLEITKALLASTLSVWNRAARHLDGGGVEDMSLRLMTSARELRERLYEQVCSISFADELELEVGISEQEHRKTGDRAKSSNGRRWHGTCVVSVVIGVLAGAFSVRLERQRLFRSRLPSVSSEVSEGMEAGVQWFSTLSQSFLSSDKSKLN